MRCPNLADPKVREQFNRLLEGLGGRPFAHSDVGAARDYLGELTDDERTALHRAYYAWNVHDSPEAARAFVDETEKLRRALRGPEPFSARPRRIRNARDLVADEAQPLVTGPMASWSDVEDVLHKMRAQRQLDQWHATELVQAAKKAGLTRADNEAIMVHMDDPSHPLTPHQRALWEEFIKPMADALGWRPGYVHREAVGKGGFFDRIKQEGGKLRQRLGVGLLRTTHPGMRSRTMKVLVDAEGNRTVVSLKPEGAGKRRVTAWVNGKPTDLGIIHFRSSHDLLERSLAPLEKAEVNLRHELKTLTATKSRSAAAKVRISNIVAKLGEIEARKDAVRFELAPGELEGYQFTRGKHVYKIAEARIPEVEEHSPVRYHKNAIGTVARQFVIERQAERQRAYLDAMKQSMLEQGIAAKAETAPADFEPVDLANFRGIVFEPHTAEVLNDFARVQKGWRVPGLGALNDILTRAMFSVLSVWHDFNIATQAIIQRGLTSWLAPAGYVRLWKTLGPAIHDVMTISPEYQRFMAKGVSFKYLSAIQGDAYRAVLESIADEFDTKPEAQGLARVLGYGPRQLADVLRWWGRHQQTSMWAFNDIAALQGIKERIAQGESEGDAIRHVYEVMPDYRMRTDLRTLNLLSHPDVTWFSRWHYGLFRSWGKLAHDLLGKVPMRDRVRAADQLAMIGILTMVVYPQLDALWQRQTGNKKASVHRFGMTAIPYDLYRLAKGQRRLSTELESVLTPARGTWEALQQFTNRDFYSGKEIRPYFETGKHNAESTLKHLAGAFLPFEEILNENLTPEDVVTSQLGLSNPPTEAERRRKALREKWREEYMKERYWREHAGQ